MPDQTVRNLAPPLDPVVGYPAETVARYRSDGVWADHTIPAAFAETVAEHAERAAVVTAAGTWSYAELDRRSDGVAAGLLRAGIRPGDPVVLQITNSIHAVAAWYGLLKAGAVPVCTLAIHRRHEIEQIGRKTRAVAHLVQADLPAFDLVAFAEQIRGLVPGMRALFTIGAGSDGAGTRIEDLEEIEPDTADRAALHAVATDTDLAQPAVFQLSGGTTDTPKVIARLHPEYWYNARTTARWWGLTEADRLAFGIPLVHNAGVTNAMHAAHSIGAALLLSTPGAGDLMPLMADHGATWLMSPPGIMADYQAHPRFAEAFAQVRDLVLTAAYVPGELFDELEALGLHVSQAFGMTEGGFLFTPRDAPTHVRRSTVGVPISPYDEVRVLEPGGLDPVPDGAIGELCVRGPYTIRGYYDEAARNVDAFTPDGFYRSGDLVASHAAGDGAVAYSIEGRVKDLINRGGEKVNASEVEGMLLTLDLVADVAVVAVPDPRLGERACAVVVVADGHRAPDLDDLRSVLRAAGMATFKWPEFVEYVDVLPRTPIGKIDKKALRAALAARAEVGRAA